MAFPRASIRTPARPRIRVAVFAVGRRVYVAGAGDRSARVTLTDGAERPLASLSDGAEVTIVAWLPGWSGTTRYCVRVTDSGLEGWLPVGDLRGTKTAIAPPPAAPPPPAPGPVAVRAGESTRSGRRFGQHF
jgi:hypothetical protein